MSAPALFFPLVVRSFGFNIPCREFVLTAKVTRDRRMPIVDEFILRALKLCERVPVNKLASFFGFTAPEMQTVLTDLVTRSLIVVDENELRLHASAIEMFRTSPNAIPHVLEVETWVEWLWFDLVSQGMIARGGLRRGRNLVEIKAAAGEIAVPVEFARQAFQENFRDYLTNVRKIHNSDQISLYAVTDVQIGQYGFVPIAGTEELVLSPVPKLAPSLLNVDSHHPRRIRKLTDAMNDAYMTLTDPEPSALARTDFARLTGCNSIQDATAPSGFVDLRKWLEHPENLSAKRVMPIVGAAYVERNRDAFKQVLQEGLCDGRNEHSRAIELIWFRPGGSSWGASDDLRASLAEIRTLIRHALDQQVVVRTALVSPPSERGHKSTRFNRVFEEGFVAPSGFLSLGVEVLILRGLAAIVLVWVPLTEGTCIWIGRATSEPDNLAEIDRKLRCDQLLSSAERLWGPQREL